MTNEQILQYFPAFDEIANHKLKENALEAMRMALEQGGWDQDTVKLCPVTLNWKNCDISLVEHVNDVVSLCVMEYDALEKYYKRHGVAFDRDIVVAGALLHDIGKLTEFALQNGQVEHSDNFKLMRHPLSGAIIAAKAGLPDKIVHLIATHSFEGERSYQTAESEFVRRIDIFAFECAVKGLEKR